jgi:hypothetical protein
VKLADHREVFRRSGGHDVKIYAGLLRMSRTQQSLGSQRGQGQKTPRAGELSR